MQWSDVLTLLQICDLSKQWPNLKHLHDSAMEVLTKAQLAKREKELTGILEEPVPRSIKRKIAESEETE